MHDLRANAHLVEYADQHWKGMKMSHYDATPEEVSKYIKFKIIEFNDTRKVTVKYINRFIEPSYHYTVNYQIDPVRDCIDWQFSIPKYLYGSNVAQFVQHRDEMSQLFDGVRQTTWKNNSNQLYDRLIKFVRSFFKTTYPNVKVNFRYLEIARIDLCFNQFFDSKTDAFHFLEYVKRIRKRYLREISKNRDRYDTGVFYKNDYYSFKIYHKGTEYQANDSKEHQRINKEKRRQVFDVKEYQAISDRILRYEITIRSQWMSRIFRAELFRKNCPTWRKRMRIYTEMHTKYKRAERTSKAKGKGQDVNGKYTWAQWMNEPKHLRKVYEQTSGMLGQTAKFMLETDAETDRYNKSGLEDAIVVVEGKPRLRKSAKFSKTLLYILMNRFRKEILHFQVKENVYLSTLDKQLMDHNEKAKVVNAHLGEKHKKQIKGQKLMQFVVLQQKYTKDEMIRMRLISKSAYYRNMQLLSEFGITGNVYSKHTIPTELGYDTYHSLLVHNRKLITANEHFK